MSASPKVSVIVTTRNAARFFAWTAASIAAQTFRDWECVVVDDRSTDGTRDAVRALCERDPRFRLLDGPGDGIPARARNAAVQAARGDYLAFCDHDDLWHPDKLARQLTAFAAYPGAAIVHTDRSLCHGVGPASDAFDPHASVRPPAPPRLDSARRALHLRCRIVQSSIMVPRSLFEAAGGFHPDLVGVDDYHLYLKLAERGAIVRIPEALTCVRVHDANMSRSRVLMQRGLAALARVLASEGARPAVVWRVRAQAWKSGLVLRVLRTRRRGTDVASGRATSRPAYRPTP